MFRPVPLIKNNIKGISLFLQPYVKRIHQWFIIELWNHNSSHSDILNPAQHNSFGIKQLSPGSKDLTIRGNYLTLRGSHLTLRGNNHTLMENNHTLRGNHLTLRGNHLTSRGSHLTLRGNNLTMRGSNLTTRGSHLTLRGSNLTWGNLSPPLSKKKLKWLFNSNSFKMNNIFNFSFYCFQVLTLKF
jgi:hypothetical protein